MTFEKHSVGYNFTKMDCRFSIEEIRQKTKNILAEKEKDWNEMQIDILAQGTENSDWLKLPEADEDSLNSEINEWIVRLEEEWEESGEFGY